MCVRLCVCVCVSMRRRLMYKSSEPKQALIKGAWWSAGKGKQRLNELAPPSSWRIIAFHQQILVADTQAYHWWGCNFFFFSPSLNLSICFCKAATYFSRETTELFFFFLSFVFVFGCQLFPSGVMFITMRIGACESDTAAAPSVSHYVSRHSFSHLLGRSAPPLSLSLFLIITAELSCPGISEEWCLLPGKWEVGTPAVHPPAPCGINTQLPLLFLEDHYGPVITLQGAAAAASSRTLLFQHLSLSFHVSSVGVHERRNLVFFFF